MMPAFLLPLLLAAAAVQQDFHRDAADSLLEFGYGWPAVVEQMPALRTRLQAEMTAAEREARAGAEADRAARGGEAPFHPHSYQRSWALAGLTPGLLSLTAETATYTGGAHGNLALTALLWDRRGDRPANVRTLLGADALTRLSPRYCARLDAMRAEKRGAPVQVDPQDDFTTCPALADQAVAPADTDGNARFDTLRVLVPPYAAGPWVEGSYIVEVPFQAGDLVGVPAANQADFEPGPRPAERAGERG